MKIRQAAKVMNAELEYGDIYRASTLNRAAARLRKRRLWTEGFSRYMAAGLTVAFLDRGYTFSEIRFNLNCLECQRRIEEL